MEEGEMWREELFFCLCAYREGGVSERREGRGRE